MLQPMLTQGKYLFSVQLNPLAIDFTAKYPAATSAKGLSRQVLVEDFEPGLSAYTL